MRVFITQKREISESTRSVTSAVKPISAYLEARWSQSGVNSKHGTTLACLVKNYEDAQTRLFVSPCSKNVTIWSHNIISQKFAYYAGVAIMISMQNMQQLHDIVCGGPYFHGKKKKKVKMWLVVALNLLTSAEAIGQHRRVTVGTLNMTKNVK